MSGAGILHTVPALAGAFQADLTGWQPGIELVHIADPWLLAIAIRTGADDRVRARIAGHLRHLADSEVEAILVTCSSIGEAVEAVADAVQIPVLRVDRPMAVNAVEIADRAAGAGPSGRVAVPGRIAVLATLQATLGPTSRLIEKELTAAGADLLLASTVVFGAIAAREGRSRRGARPADPRGGGARSRHGRRRGARAGFGGPRRGRRRPGGTGAALTGRRNAVVARSARNVHRRKQQTMSFHGCVEPLGRVDRICGVSVSFSTSN